MTSRILCTCLPHLTSGLFAGVHGQQVQLGAAGRARLAHTGCAVPQWCGGGAPRLRAHISGTAGAAPCCCCPVTRVFCALLASALLLRKGSDAAPCPWPLHSPQKHLGSLRLCLQACMLAAGGAGSSCTPI